MLPHCIISWEAEVASFSVEFLIGREAIIISGVNMRKYLRLD
jgi:hypothetical protein